MQLDLVSCNFGMPLALTVVTITAVYLYYCQKLNYWKSRGVPSARPQFIFPASGNDIQDSYWKTEMENYTKLGRVHGTFEGTTPSLTVGDPHLIKLITIKDSSVFPNIRGIETGDKIMSSILLFLKDERWRRVRSVITPSFTSGKIRKMEHLVHDCTRTLLNHFLKASEKGEIVDCRKYFGAFTIDTIAACAFGTKINSQEDVNNPFVVHTSKLFAETSKVSEILASLFPWLFRLLNISVYPPDTMKFFVDTLTCIINQRKKLGEQGYDFLQLIMDARDRKVDEVTKGKELDRDTSEENRVPKSSNKMLSEEEAIAQCITFFFAGYDTTANTLTSASYALALNPDCQEKLIQEVDQVWEENKGKIDFDIASKMQYLDAFICETLRLYTVVIRVERIANEDYVLGDTGITIPKGMVVGIPLHAIHHDPEWYPDPEKFDPERFSPENKAERHPCKFLPFGSGQRSCVGMRFAMAEAKLCLVHLLRHIQFVRSAKTKIPLEHDQVIGILQPKGVLLKVVKRSTTHQT